MRPRRSSATLPLLLTVLALLVSACGGADEVSSEAGQTAAASASGTSSTAAASDAAYNAADIAFLRGMIPHHRGAIQMAELVPDRTDRPELNQLADEIVATQQPEIEQMEAMLADAGEPASGAMEDMEGMEGMSSMGGMMGEAQMSDLGDAEGAAFDLMFIDMMIAHHQGAIDAAEQVSDQGSNPQALALADEVIAAQQAEIDEMTEWRQTWSDATQ